MSTEHLLRSRTKTAEGENFWKFEPNWQFFNQISVQQKLKDIEKGFTMVYLTKCLKTSDWKWFDTETWNDDVFFSLKQGFLHKDCKSVNTNVSKRFCVLLNGILKADKQKDENKRSNNVWIFYESKEVIYFLNTFYSWYFREKFVQFWIFSIIKTFKM